MSISVQPLMEVTADYQLTDQDGTLLDSSDTSAPMRYVHGTGQLLFGLEQALEGHTLGDTIRVTLTPEDAFGEHRPELVFEAVRDNLPEAGADLQPGMTLTPGGQQGRFQLKVVQLTEAGALLDGNHPYAGKTLTWELTITSLSDQRPPIQNRVDHTPIRWTR